MDKQEFRQMLEDGLQSQEDTGSRLEYLGNFIFDFTTYDGSMSELFASKALEVCSAISGKTTFQYIEDPLNYQWSLLMCNMPFFAKRLEWGTSIRGAWWDGPKIKLDSCGLCGYDQVEALELTTAQWHEFIEALIEFAGVKEPAPQGLPP